MDAAARGEVWRAGGDSGPADAADAWLAEHEPAASLRTTPAPNRLSGWQDAAAPPTTTLLLRHGQTVLSVEKRFSGIGDPALTEVGRAQAAAAAARLAAAAPTAVVSSPLRRARADGRARRRRARASRSTSSEGLRETDFGDWEGYTFAEVREKWPRELDAWLGRHRGRAAVRRELRRDRRRACGRRATGCSRRTAGRRSSSSAT